MHPVLSSTDPGQQQNVNNSQELDNAWGARVVKMSLLFFFPFQLNSLDCLQYHLRTSSFLKVISNIWWGRG